MATKRRRAQQCGTKEDRMTGRKQRDETIATRIGDLMKLI